MKCKQGFKTGNLTNLQMLARTPPIFQTVYFTLEIWHKKHEHVRTGSRAIGRRVINIIKKVLALGTRTFESRSAAVYVNYYGVCGAYQYKV